MKKLAFIFALACLLPAIASATHTCTTCYIDYENGNDSWDGTSKVFTSGTTGPWKHAPGDLGLTPANTSTGDGCTANCASQVPVAGDKYIRKGGVIWPYTTAPHAWSWSGTSTTSGTYGCVGTGCIYIGIDPTWNKGIVNSVTLQQDLGQCNPASPPTITISGGGGSGATAAALIMPASAAAVEPNIAGLAYHINVTAQGSGYTSNPTVTVTGCPGLIAVADIQRAILDGGGLSLIKWSVGFGPGQTNRGPGLQMGTSHFVIVDNLEIRNIYQAVRGAGTANPDGIITAFMGMEFGAGGHNTFSNNYLHGRTTDCLVNACGANVSEDADRAIIPAPNDEIANNVIENGDAVMFTLPGTRDCGGASGSPCAFSEHGINGGGFLHNNYIYSVRWWTHLGQNSAGLDTIALSNEMWGVFYDVNSSQHENEMYTQMTTGVFYNANNIMHSAVSGASDQQQMGNGTTQYFFNDISWGLGGGTPNYGLDAIQGGGVSGGHFYFFNNTMQGNGSGTRVCIDSNSGTFAADLFTVLQGNHCITNANPFWSAGAATNWTNFAGSAVVATVTASNVEQTNATAISQGYTIANLFAPQSTSADTVTFNTNPNAVNLNTFCGTLNALVINACESDIRGVRRATPGAWNAGAYEFVGGGSPGVSFSPSPLNFGNVNIQRSPGVNQTLTLTNTGTATLTVFSNSVSGLFSLISTTCGSLPYTVGAGSSCTFTIQASPTALGPTSGTFTINDNASGSPHSVTLNATGTAPAFTLTPSSYAFGNVPILTTASSTNFTLTNTGTGTGNVAFSTGGANPTFFGQASTTCGPTLAAGASCFVAASFSPTTVTSYSATLVQTDSVNSVSTSSALTGSGVAASTIPTAPATIMLTLNCQVYGSNVQCLCGPKNCLVKFPIAALGKPLT